MTQEDLLERSGDRPPPRRTELDAGLDVPDMVYFNRRIWNRIKHDAKKNHRSFSAEVHLILMAHFYGEGSKATVPGPKGTRIDEDFRLTEPDYVWAFAKFSLRRSECDEIAARFKDYWLARTGRGALKTDWRATWRSWVRKELAAGVRGAGPGGASAGPATARAAGNRSMVAAAGRVLDREQARAARR